MKLDLGFLESLRRNVEQMGAKWRDFDLQVKFESAEIDKELDRGIAIGVDEIEFNDKILTYEGRQVLLYIPDQGRNFENILINPEKGRRFHVADCKTLKSMREQNRFDRYVVTNNLSGLFDITGIGIDGKEREGKAELKVCQNCLRLLNYKGFATHRNMAIFKNFNLEEFFEDYSTYFRFHPKYEKPYGSAYVEDWEKISRQYREANHYRCESCGIDLSHHKRLLTTHHINGVKSDNDENNLKALCVDCHRKQPYHSHLFISREEMLTIYRLRHEQNKNYVSDWQDVYRLVDKAFYGVVEFLQAEKSPLPEVGYPVDHHTYVDLAWPAQKKAANVNHVIVNGWTIKRPHDILHKFGEQ